MANSGEKNRHDATMPLTPPGARVTSGGGDALLGQKIDDRYELKIVLGEGGMGKVYLAEDAKLGRRVALKLMGAGLTMDPEFRQRFEREAVLQANLPHPQIVQIIDMGETPEGAFIVMEYSDGRSLARLLRELGPLPLDRALEVTEQILEVLDFAHGQNVVHRDLKPANILVEERPGREVIRLLDFGIAKLISSEGGEGLAHTLTRQGYAYGTLGYMAPEQARGEIEKVDHRVDVYAVGIMLHEMLTGELPAPPESRTHPVRYAMWVAENQIRPLAESHPELQVAEVVDQIMQQALRRDPDNRYQSAFAFRNAIREFRQSADARTVARDVGAGLASTEHLGSAAPSGARKGGTRKSGGGVLAWVAAGVLAAAAGIASFMYIQEKDAAATANDELDKVKATFGALELPSDDVDEGIRELKFKMVKLQREAKGADPAVRDRLEGEITQLKADVKEAESKSAAATGALAEKETSLVTATKQLETARGDLSRAQKELKELKARPANGGADPREMAKAKERIEILEGEVTQLNKDKEQLRNQLSASAGGESTRITELTGQLDEAKKKGERLERESADAKRESETLGTRNRELTAELKRESQAAEANRQEAGRMRAEAASARGARDALQGEVQQKNTDIFNKDNEIARLKSDVQRLGQGGGGSRQSGEVARLKTLEQQLRRNLEAANQRIAELERRGGGGGGGAQPTIGPTALTIVNRFSHPVQIVGIEATLQDRRVQRVQLPSDDRITSRQSRQVQLPAGTIGVKVIFYRFNWQNKRFTTRRVEAEAGVRPPRATIEVK